MKYRIVEQVYEDYTNYLVQKRVLWIWVNEVRPVNEASFCNLVFPTLCQAKGWIERQTPAKDKLLVSRVVE